MEKKSEKIENDTGKKVCYSISVKWWDLMEPADSFIQKENINMEYCPFCGAELMSGTVSFCSACGSRLRDPGETVTEEIQQDDAPVNTAKEIKQKKPKKNKAEAPKNIKIKDIPEITDTPLDDGYDGYYDDVLPPDYDLVQDGIDKDLIRKVIFLFLGVSAIILTCVALLYVL